MIVALLPAAGQSKRMGRPKLTLPLGNVTVIERVIQTLRQAGVEDILLVSGPNTPELASLAEMHGARVLLLKEQTAEMRQTIDVGLSFIEQSWNPSDNDAFLLVPADHPALDSEVIKRLVNYTTHSSERQNILIPTFQGKRGHPTLIPWHHVAGIRALPPDVGLNAYLRAHPDAVREVPVESDSILLDLDTPEDYERLQANQDRREAGD